MPARSSRSVRREIFADPKHLTAGLLSSIHPAPATKAPIHDPRGSPIQGCCRPRAIRTTLSYALRRCWHDHPELVTTTSADPDDGAHPAGTSCAAGTRSRHRTEASRCETSRGGSRPRSKSKSTHTSRQRLALPMFSPTCDPMIGDVRALDRKRYGVIIDSDAVS